MPISAQYLIILSALFEHLFLLMIRDVLIAAEVVFNKFDDCSREQEHTDQVRDSHESVECLSDFPDDSEVHGSSEDSHKSIYDQERLGSFASEDELGELLAAFRTPAVTDEEKASKIARVKDMYLRLGVADDAQEMIREYTKEALRHAAKACEGVRYEILKRFADKLVGRTS